MDREFWQMGVAYDYIVVFRLVTITSIKHLLFGPNWTPLVDLIWTPVSALTTVLFLACSQTFCFLFNVRRARVIKNKPQRIYIDRKRKGEGAGEEENSYFFFLSRSPRSLSRTPTFSKRTKRKIKQRLCTG